MPKTSTQILTKHQKELLGRLLELTEDKDEALTLTELEGFLFGLAITPDVIMTSEWLPEIFGGEIPTFETKEQADLLIKNLLEIYNAYQRASHTGTLKFPFDMKKLSGEMIDDIQDWSFGLLGALRMRPEIWHIADEEEFEDASEDVRDVVLSFCVLYGIVHPDESKDLFIKHGKPLNDEAESAAIFFSSLPYAVETLQAHGARLEKERHRDIAQGRIDLNPSKIKIGRNDPCPCGSGKKYKKCCGMN
jgi:uncharacterized protein